MKYWKINLVFLAIFALTANAAEVRESFPSTEDATTGSGVPLTSVEEGDAASGVNASAALVGKDDSGNLIYLSTDSNGAIYVNTEDAAGIKKYARGKVTGALSMQDVAVITLTSSKTYSGIDWVVSSFRSGVCEIFHNNDGTPTILADIIIGPGDYTDSGRLPNLEFVAGASGTQELKIQCESKWIASDIRASITTKQKP